MERQVCIQQGCDVVLLRGPFHSNESLLNVSNIISLFRRKSRCQALQDSAHFIDLPYVFRAQVNDSRATPQGLGNEAVGGEKLDGFPDGGLRVAQRRAPASLD